MTDEQRADGRVAREPAFAEADPIVFARPPEQLTFPVTLRFSDDAIGRRATVSTGATAPLVAETTLAAADWHVRLASGAYVAFVPDLGIFSAFAVTGGEQDQVVTVQ
jgi:hypothetical protein